MDHDIIPEAAMREHQEHFHTGVRVSLFHSTRLTSKAC